MHLFAVAVNLPEIGRSRITSPLAELAGEFELDADTAWWAASADERVRAAGVHHGAERAGPRRYLSRSDDAVTLFDGLPVALDDQLRGVDAAELERAWPQLPERLDGQFCAARVDLRAGTVEVLMDTLGFVPVYVGRRGDGHVISNSADVVASLLGLSSVDALGASSFLGLGWAASDRTLVAGVDILCGGAMHRIAERGLETRRWFGPAGLASRSERARALTVEGLAESLVALTRRATENMPRVESALTGGRDSRMLLALLKAAGVDAHYFTGGPEHLPDVYIARELGERFGLDHEVTRHDAESDDLDWTDAAARFMRQNEGLTSLLQIGDYIDLSSRREPLGVKLSGMGERSDGPARAT